MACTCVQLQGRVMHVSCRLVTPDLTPARIAESRPLLAMQAEKLRSNACHSYQGAPSP